MRSSTEQNSFAIYTKPGLHSYNVRRRTAAPERRGLPLLRILLLLAGFSGLGYYGFTVAKQYIDQAYENWAFDQEIAGRRGTFNDWLMQTTPLGKWTGYTPPPVTGILPGTNPKGASQRPVPEQTAPPPSLPEGTLLGRVEIPRLHLSSVVRQGVSAETLSSAVGHVPSTQGPGALGNFAIAAHRDTLFRALKDIKIGDTVRFESPAGDFNYQVISTQIVKPSNVSVLRPQGAQKLLTMITCYPFYYVGSAPKRFIVTARLKPDERSAAQLSGVLSDGLRR
jgi:sortase A